MQCDYSIKEYSAFKCSLSAFAFVLRNQKGFKCSCTVYTFNSSACECGHISATALWYTSALWSAFTWSTFTCNLYGSLYSHLIVLFLIEYNTIYYILVHNIIVLLLLRTWHFIQGSQKGIWMLLFPIFLLSLKGLFMFTLWRKGTFIDVSIT